ncbi:MAG: aldehyde dehydrogenase (NADP(+)) [Anaerolineae bacterium]|nr:aldehyde dehydrogenase (NADP(+)) [Anaerolineae bacterium]
MTLSPVLIDGLWRQSQNPVGQFTAVNPATKTALPDDYPVSSWPEGEEALCAAQKAVSALRTLPCEYLADFLEQYAANIEKRAHALVKMAHLETALPEEPRLHSVELPRTTDQLRQAAAAVRDRSWRHATLDVERNIRSIYSPLGGAVAVFGPNNFPFAFNSAAGGDFAAAIAAGNPVIAKGNTGHPGTTRLFAEAAFEAVQQTGLPPAMVQLLYRIPPEVGFQLVSHPLIGATGFTGSRAAGLRLKEAADRAGKPIYLELSSINPIFILPGALQERPEAIAAELFASCSLGVGQFCTKPGFVVLMQDPAGETFLDKVHEHFTAPSGILLGAGGVRTIAQAITKMQQHGAEVMIGGAEIEGEGYRYANTLLRVPGDTYLANPHALQIEAFGVVSLVVLARNAVQMRDIARSLEGNLTGSFYTHTQGADDTLYDQLAPIVRDRVGRLLNDKMPTGVAVSPAMNHGGPYPSTGHPGFTSVGIPAAMKRFTALHCYDNVRPYRLPPELQDRNPTGTMWRIIDGTWTQADA